MSDSNWLSLEQIEELGALLARGEAIDHDLPLGARLHIDRPQPFLIVYRTPPKPTDSGMEFLLGGLASYLIAPGGKGCRGAVAALTRHLLDVLAEAFGTVALIELSTIKDIDSAASPSDGPEVPNLRLTAPAKGAPTEALESFEHAVASTDWPVQVPKVEVRYAALPHPPGLPSLIEKSKAAEQHITAISLELSPVFRDPESGDLYPEIHRGMRAALGHVLKQMLYTFYDTASVRTPTHYHELGSQSLTDDVWAVDKALSEVSDAFDLLLHITPVNTDNAFHAFKRSNFERSPEFHYRPLRLDPGEWKQRLFSIPLETVDDPALHQIFFEKRDELDKQLTLLTDRGTSSFRYGSLQLFGAAGEDDLKVARALLDQIPPHIREGDVSDSVSAEDFAAMAQVELDAYKELAPGLAAKIYVQEDIPGLIVSSGNLFIGSHARVPRARIEATLHHEVGTHMLTYYNGKAQRFQQLHSGLAQYEELQEGLAVFSEYLVGGLSRPRLRLLAGRAMAAEAMIEGAGFVSTYRLLHDDYEFNQRVAFSVAMRAHRGGGYVKDVIYLRGLIRLLDYLSQGGDFDMLLVGKIGFRQISVMEELKWRRVLTTDILRPRYLTRADVKHRLAKVQEGMSVLDMIDGAPS